MKGLIILRLSASSGEKVPSYVEHRALSVCLAPLLAVKYQLYLKAWGDLRSFSSILGTAVWGPGGQGVRQKWDLSSEGWHTIGV